MDTPIFPKKDAAQTIKPVSIRAPPDLWKRLERIAKAERVSRNAAVVTLLEWAAGVWEKQPHQEPPPSSGPVARKPRK
jgi:hypothetical protein